MAGKMVFRFILAGDGAVGKTSLRNTYMGKGFTTTHNMTIGADFAAKDVSVEVDGRNYNMVAQIWDIAGQQRFTELRSRFYLGAKAALCVFDVTRPKSFQNISSWIEEVWRNNGGDPPYIPIVLLGNKSDLRDRKSVNKKQVEEFCDKLSARTAQYGYNVLYIETSAKTGENVNLAFETLAKTVIRASMKF